jgi:hypothetical protein
MPLSQPSVPRKPMHNRSIQVHSFEREDGLWDVEAELIDTKSYDFTRKDGGIRPAGFAFHHMHLRITINDDFDIVHSEAAYDSAPFGEQCTQIAPVYGDLVGMNLLKSFRQQVKDRFARTNGCTHITELAAVLPTAAIQTMSSRRRKDPSKPQKKPYMLGGCHAWRLDGPVTKEYYPQWYESPTTIHPQVTDLK